MVPEFLVIHHSLTSDGKTVSWPQIRWYHIHTNGWNDVGYHLCTELIGDSYEILLGRMLDKDGAHCKEEGMNRKSIGICVIGNFDLAPVPAAQMDKLIELVQSLQRIFKIPKEKVKKHSDYATYKSCPGKLFQWDYFQGRLI